MTQNRYAQAVEAAVMVLASGIEIRSLPIEVTEERITEIEEIVCTLSAEQRDFWTNGEIIEEGLDPLTWKMQTVKTAFEYMTDAKIKADKLNRAGGYSN